MAKTLNVFLYEMRKKNAVLGNSRHTEHMHKNTLIYTYTIICSSEHSSLIYSEIAIRLDFQYLQNYSSIGPVMTTLYNISNSEL